MQQLCRICVKWAVSWIFIYQKTCWKGKKSLIFKAFNQYLPGLGEEGQKRDPVNEVDESNLKRVEYDEFRLISPGSTPTKNDLVINIYLPSVTKRILISFEHGIVLFTG